MRAAGKIGEGSTFRLPDGLGPAAKEVFAAAFVSDDVTEFTGKTDDGIEGCHVSGFCCLSM